MSTVSKMAQLDRSEIYRGILELQKLGLVERILSTPNMFKSTPMSDGLAILLARKTDEFNEIKKRTAQLIQKSESENQQVPLQEEHSFVIIPERQVALRKWMKMTENAQTCFDYIIRWEGYIDGLAKRGDHLREILNRGVKVRAIISKPQRQRTISRTINSLRKDGNYEVRYISVMPSAVFSIVDKREVLLNTVPTPIPSETPSLWSNNPSLAAIVQDHFEMMWHSAREYRTGKTCRSSGEASGTVAAAVG